MAASASATWIALEMSEAAPERMIRSAFFLASSVRRTVVAFVSGTDDLRLDGVVLRRVVDDAVLAGVEPGSVWPLADSRTALAARRLGTDEALGVQALTSGEQVRGAPGNFVPRRDCELKVAPDHVVAGRQAVTEIEFPPPIKWQELDDDRELPTQYYFREAAGTLIAYSKDHTYIWDEKAEAWVKVAV